MRFNIIFATNNNLLFGYSKEDLQNFNRITCDIYQNNIVVMSKNTWLSLPMKLENRVNVVISKSELEKKDYDYKYDNIMEFIKNHKVNNTKIFIIGGAKMIEDIINNIFYIIDTIYYTIVDSNSGDGVYISQDIINKIEPYLIKRVKNNMLIYSLYKIHHDEYNYLNLLEKCLLNGNVRQTRNSITYSIFNDMISFDLTKGFPLLTTKKVFMRGIFEELMFFLRGQTNSKILEEKGVNIWKPNTTKEFIEKNNLKYNEGDMGPMYGFQWKHFNEPYIDCNTKYKGHDQIEDVINLLIQDPYSRRILMTTYNPAQAKEGVLYPCHSIVIQFYVHDNMISMSMYQRSSDLFLGLPFNIASNALLLHLICCTVNKRLEHNKYNVGKLNIILGDIHIYKDHIDAVKEQLTRIPYNFPTIEIKNQYSDIMKYEWNDIILHNYISHPTIRASMVA